MTTHPSRRPLLAALAALAILAAACGGGGGGTHGLRDIRRLPHTTAGALLLAPPRDATGVSPSQPVIVQTRYSDVFLQRVTLTREGGEAIAGTLTSGRFVAEGVLKPDATYTLTAVATLPAAAGVAAPLACEQKKKFALITWPTSCPKLRTSGVGLNAKSSAAIASAASAMSRRIVACIAFAVAARDGDNNLSNPPSDVWAYAAAVSVWNAIAAASAERM